MKRTYSFLFVIAISVLYLSGGDLFAQPFTVWSKLYNGPLNQQDSAVGICINPSGNVFITGWSIGSGTSADIVTIRYNPETGDTVWVNRFNGAANQEDKVSAITCDANAVYVTGWSFTGSPATRDIVTIKYDAATGSRLWVKTYNGSNNGGDYGFSIALNSGNVYVTGRSDVTGGVGQKFTTLKYDASGNMVSGWPNIYTGSLSTTFDQAQAIKVDGSGNAYITGKSGTTGAENYLTMKINNDGTLAWAKKI